MTANAADCRPLDASRALVIDDDTDSREALEILLSWTGYQVMTASNGMDGLAAANEFLPQIIFLDIGMPEMSGYDVCRKLRASAQFSEAKIYALSGFTGVDHDTRCSEAGFTAKFTKPIDPAVLHRLR